MSDEKRNICNKKRNISAEKRNMYVEKRNTYAQKHNLDWRWSGLEKKMKWIGLEWRKGGGIGEKSCPKTHCFKKTNKT